MDITHGVYIQPTAITRDRIMVLVEQIRLETSERSNLIVIIILESMRWFRYNINQIIDLEAYGILVTSVCYNKDVTNMNKR